MLLIVDCYNVLHTGMPPSLAGLDELALCRLLGRGPWRQAVVVCDGTLKPSVPSSSPVPRVKLTYAGKGRSADSLIIEMVNRSSAPRRLLVVSSDRAIQKAVRRRRAHVWPSNRLVTELASLARSNEHRLSTQENHSAAQSGDVQYWLAQFGIDEDDDLAIEAEDEFYPGRRGADDASLEP